MKPIKQAMEDAAFLCKGQEVGDIIQVRYEAYFDGELQQCVVGIPQRFAERFLSQYGVSVPGKNVLRVVRDGEDNGVPGV